MSRTPLVSIVTPSFNQGGFIGETIDSVLTQDYPRIEYLIVDGGSTDGTLDILKRYDGRLSWVSEPDRGQSDAINKGWRKSRGDIIAWLNADDLYRPGALRKVVAFFQEHPHIDLVYGDCEYLDEQGADVELPPIQSADRVQLIISPYSIIAQPATFLRRRVLETVGYLDETLHLVMDLEYWLRVATRHDIAHLPECLAAFRLHGGAKTNRRSAIVTEERLSVYERLFKLPDLPSGLRRLERIAMRNAYWRAANDCFMLGDLSQARRYALTAWRRLPLKLDRPQLKVLMLGILGPPGARLAARLNGTRGTVGSQTRRRTNRRGSTPVRDS